nr:hypothetical protein [Paenibacillus sp. P22]
MSRLIRDQTLPERRGVKCCSQPSSSAFSLRLSIHPQRKAHSRASSYAIECFAAPFLAIRNLMPDDSPWNSSSQASN